MLFLCAVPCYADVLFIHNYKIKQYVIGEKNAELAIGYTDQAMYLDMTTQYVGSWMKRFFGGVKQEKETTHFLLDKNQIHEIDWYKGQVIIFPFERLKDTSWMKQMQKNYDDTAEFLKARYRVLEPKLTLNTHPEPEILDGYSCKRTEAHLRLETVDIKKKATSVTLVNQTVWTSEDVPGFDQYTAFHSKLGEKLGIDAERFGNLSFMLRYWNGSLAPISEQLKAIRGYPVKRILIVEAQYITGTDTDYPQVISKQIKEEAMQLKKVSLDKLDKKRFMPPSEFGVKTVK